MKNIQLLLLTLCLVFFTNCTTTGSQTAPKTADHPIYLQLYSVRDDISKDFDATIQKVAEMGYDGIEAANYDNGKFYGMTPTEFKDKIEGLGMTVLSSHTGKALPADVTTTNWDEVWSWWDQCINAHKEAGMQYIVVPAMPRPSTLEALQVYCDYYNQIGEKCQAAGMKFGYHNHDFEFVDIEGQLMYDYMIQNTDPDKVLFEMDVYWVMRAGKSPVEYFEKYPGRFKVLHLKDHKELGQSGMVGFDAIFKNLAKAGTEKLVVEVERYNFEPLKSVELSLEYLNNTLD